MKILYFDTETTGINPVTNGIIQLSGSFEIDGVEKFSFDYKMNIFESDEFDIRAAAVHGYSLEDLEDFESPADVYFDFTSELNKYINKYDRSDKFYPAGFNVGFDVDFLNQWFIKNGDKYFGSYCNWRRLDPLPFLYMADARGEISLENYKLETVAAHFGIEIKAHDAKSDSEVAKELIKKIIYSGESCLLK